MGKLIVELPEEAHRELKKKAAANHKTLKDIVSGLIDEYLFASEKHVFVKKTGLCGSWTDTRRAEEIIREIKTHRKWFMRKNH